MNARYYLPAIGRFLTRHSRENGNTLVPDPANPQSFNRYAYVLNNPLNRIDPTGHCAQSDDECWNLADQLYQLYGWYIDSEWTTNDVQIFLEAAQGIAAWFERNGGGDAIGRMRKVFGGTHIAHADWIGQGLLEAHHVRGTTVYLLSVFDKDMVIHELGHVLDNKLGFTGPIGSALFGGGVADDMAEFLGADPTACWNRSQCSGYSTPLEPNHPTTYAKSGPSEDFAESFMYSVMNSSYLENINPERTSFLASLAGSLTTAQSEFVNSPYLSRRIAPILAPTPPTNPIPTGTPIPAFGR